jgi:hypothetical protein
MVERNIIMRAQRVGQGSVAEATGREEGKCKVQAERPRTREREREREAELKNRTRARSDTLVLVVRRLHLALLARRGAVDPAGLGAGLVGELLDRVLAIE